MMSIFKRNQPSYRLIQLSNMSIDNIGEKQVIEVYKILGHSTDPTIQSSAIKLLKHWQDELQGAPIITPTRAIQFQAKEKYKFQMFILDTFTVANVGTFASGMVFQGSLKIGDELMVQKANGVELATRCLNLENMNMLEVSIGAILAIQLENVLEKDLNQGDALIIR